MSYSGESQQSVNVVYISECTMGADALDSYIQSCAPEIPLTYEVFNSAFLPAAAVGVRPQDIAIMRIGSPSGQYLDALVSALKAANPDVKLIALGRHLADPETRCPGIFDSHIGSFREPATRDKLGALIRRCANPQPE